MMSNSINSTKTNAPSSEELKVKVSLIRDYSKQLDQLNPEQAFDSMDLSVNRQKLDQAVDKLK